jgi:hypothetical protein
MSDSIQNIVKLAEEMVKIERQIESLKSELQVKQDQFKQISSIDLPTMMASIGLNKFSLSSGFDIVVKPVLILNRPPPERMELADQWLTKHGHEGMVKTTIDISLGKGSRRIPEIKYVLDNLKIQYLVKKDINYQTLNAWGKEMERENKVIPEDIFSVHRYNITVIE